MKQTRRVLAVLLALLLALSVMSVAVFAVPGTKTEQTFLIDDFNRDTLKDKSIMTNNGGAIFWYNGNGQAKTEMVDGAVKIDYQKDGWFALGVSMDATQYKYLVFDIKGAAGGEEKGMYLGFGDGTGVYADNGVCGNDLVNFKTADGAAPAITTEYKKIAIDMDTSELLIQAEDNAPMGKMEKTFLALHVNFNGDTPGTVYINNIYLSTTPDAVPDDSAAPAGGDEEKTTEAKVEKTTEPKDEAATSTPEATSAPAADDGNKGEPVDTAKVIFFVLAGLVVLLGIAGIVYYVMKKKKDPTEEADAPKEDTTPKDDGNDKDNE